MDNSFSNKVCRVAEVSKDLAVLFYFDDIYLSRSSALDAVSSFTRFKRVLESYVLEDVDPSRRWVQVSSVSGQVCRIRLGELVVLLRSKWGVETWMALVWFDAIP